MATSVPTSLAPLLLFARISGLLVSALVISWALLFKSSFRPQSTSQEDLIYAVLHPLLMVIGLILISGEGNFGSINPRNILVDRSLIGLLYYSMVVAYRMEVDSCFCCFRFLFFFVLAISAILVHKWLPGSRGFKKSVHLCLQGLALAWLVGFLGFGQSFMATMGLRQTFSACILGWV